MIGQISSMASVNPEIIFCHENVTQKPDFQYHLAVEDGEEAYTKNEDEKMEIKLEEECQGEVVSNLTQKSLAFLKKLAAQHGDLQAKGKTALCHILLEHFRLVHGADQALANQSRPKRKYTKRDVTRSGH